MGKCVCSGLQCHSSKSVHLIFDLHLREITAHGISEVLSKKEVSA